MTAPPLRPILLVFAALGALLLGIVACGTASVLVTVGR